MTIIQLYKLPKKIYLNWFYLLLITILLLGIFFRFTHLDTKIYWGDETVTSLRLSGYNFEELKHYVFNQPILSGKDLQQFQYPNPEKTIIDTIKGLATEEPQLPPLYFILARFWVQIWGDSVAVTRSFSAVISLLAFPGIYWLCKELFNSSLTGWITISLMAISPFHVLFAQEARPYCIWTVTIIFSSAALLRAIRLGNNFSWGIYALITALGLYSFLFSILVSISQGIYVIYQEKFSLTKALKLYLFTSGIAFISFIPWIITIVNHLSQANDTTSWTKLPVSLMLLVKTWLLNLSRIFIDFNDNFVYRNLLMYLLILGIFILVCYSFYYLITTTPPKIWLFIVSLTAVTAFVLVIPDLVLGGRRSSALRYALPCVIGVEIAVSYFLASSMTRVLSKSWYPIAGNFITIILITLGIVSCSVSSQSDAWWNKTVHIFYPELVKIVNQHNPTLIITDWVHIMTLGHLVAPHVKLHAFSGEGESSFSLFNSQFSEVFVTSKKAVNYLINENKTYNLEKHYQWKQKTEPAMEVESLMWRLGKNEINQ